MSSEAFLDYRRDEDQRGNEDLFRNNMKTSGSVCLLSDTDTAEVEVSSPQDLCTISPAESCLDVLTIITSKLHLPLSASL